MSGGHYQYQYYKLNMLADEIEGDFINGGKYEGEEMIRDEKSFNYGSWRKVEKDHLCEANEEEKEIILKEVRSLINTLNSLSDRCKNLEWFMSGDHGAKTYVKLIKNEI